MAFTAYDWIIANRKTPLGRLSVKLAARVLRHNPFNSKKFSNALMCERLVQAIPRIGPDRTFYSSIPVGTRATFMERMMDLESVLLTGDENDQAHFLATYEGTKLIQLPPSRNTPEEVEKVLSWAEGHPVEGMICLAHETITTRAHLTFIKQLLRCNSKLRIYPYAHIEPDRFEGSPDFLEAITLYEAIRLWRYQRKGDAATFMEAMGYIKQAKLSPMNRIPTMCVVF